MFDFNCERLGKQQYTSMVKSVNYTTWRLTYQTYLFWNVNQHIVEKFYKSYKFIYIVSQSSFLLLSWSIRLALKLKLIHNPQLFRSGSFSSCTLDKYVEKILGLIWIYRKDICFLMSVLRVGRESSGKFCTYLRSLVSKHQASKDYSHQNDSLTT